MITNPIWRCMEKRPQRGEDFTMSQKTKCQCLCVPVCQAYELTKEGGSEECDPISGNWKW